MTRCIILDGWHKGHMVDMPRVLPMLSLIRPRTITIDDCCGGDMVGDIKNGREDYQLAFRALDGEVALYSTDGSSKAIYSQRAWVTPRDKNWLEQPLYVGIHDARASIDYKSLEEHSND